MCPQTKEKYTTCAIPLPLLFVPYMSPLSGSGFPSKNPGPCEHHISRDQCQEVRPPPQLTDNRNIPGGGKGGGRKPSGLGALHWLHSVLQAKFWFPHPLGKKESNVQVKYTHHLCRAPKVQSQPSGFLPQHQWKKHVWVNRQMHYSTHKILSPKAAAGHGEGNEAGFELGI